MKIKKCQNYQKGKGKNINLAFRIIGFGIVLLALNFGVSAQTKKFDGTWAVDKVIYGKNVSLSLEVKQKGKKLVGSYGNFSTKQSEGKILSSRIRGNVAFLVLSCDWGGHGTAKITRLSGNRLHWQVIKRDARKGQFIVLGDEILKKQ